METNDIYIITAQTNMHVGSGDVNFGVIDNLIQRDTIFDLPNINSSSLKGALRSYFRQNSDPAFVKKVFGSEARDSGDGLLQGCFRFFEANLLSIPARSDKTPFFIATCPMVINDLLQRCDLFGCSLQHKDVLTSLGELNVSKGEPIVFKPEFEGAIIEEFSFRAIFNSSINDDRLKEVENIFGPYPFVLLNDVDFRSLCSNESLPVVSRNNIENGESKNLWYEQVLPRYSQLYFAVIKNNDEEKVFEEKLEEKPVQIGANATIGYGYTSIKKITGLKSVGV